MVGVGAASASTCGPWLRPCAVCQTARPAASHGAEVARKISTGMVFVNHPTMVKADLPFGGIRHSGPLGLGIKEFVNQKLIDVVDINAEF
jgi:acyl-CoA reductase-like NAD-dependent aldehyde dehydrogenase